jgi:hypothetical protein
MNILKALFVHRLTKSTKLLDRQNPPGVDQHALPLEWPLCAKLAKSLSSSEDGRDECTHPLRQEFGIKSVE